MRYQSSFYKSFLCHLKWQFVVHKTSFHQRIGHVLLSSKTYFAKISAKGGGGKKFFFFCFRLTGLQIPLQYTKFDIPYYNLKIQFLEVLSYTNPIWRLVFDIHFIISEILSHYLKMALIVQCLVDFAKWNIRLQSCLLEKQKWISQGLSSRANYPSKGRDYWGTIEVKFPSESPTKKSYEIDQFWCYIVKWVQHIIKAIVRQAELWSILHWFYSPLERGE